MRTVRRSWFVPAVLMAFSAFPFRSAHACGAAVHRMAASMAISKVKDNNLRALLSTTGGDGDYRRWYLSGSVFPDAMKWGGDDHFHWAKFLNRYAEVIVDECREKAGTVCKQRIAHFLGVIVHQRSDNRWDEFFVTAVNAKCGFDDRAGKAHHWADYELDAIASCQYKDFGKNNGLTFIQDVEAPKILLTVMQRFDANLTSTVGAKDFEDKLSKALGKQQDALAEENQLVDNPWSVQACVDQMKKQKPNPFRCEWGSKPENYYVGASGASGSITDIGRDVLPDWLDTTYDALMKAIRNPSINAPTFSQKGSGMERSLCRNWIAESAKFCQ